MQLLLSRLRRVLVEELPHQDGSVLWGSEEAWSICRTQLLDRDEKDRALGLIGRHPGDDVGKKGVPRRLPRTERRQESKSGPTNLGQEDASQDTEDL